MRHTEEEKKRLLAVIEGFGADGSGPGQLSMLLTQAGIEKRLSLEQVAGEDSAFADLKCRLAADEEQRLAMLDGFTRDPELDALLEAHHASLDEFDLFELLDLYRRELIHSKILAWLLDPNQNHRLGDRFLRGFLIEAESANAEDFDASDWSGVTVECEWSAGDQGRLDILIVNGRSRILCAIENKVFSREGIDPDETSQLTRYREALEREFPDFTRHHVFLSPDGRNAQHEEEREFWTPMTYGVIHRLVEQEAADSSDALSEEVRLFLQQYATTIRRNLMLESEEVRKLARKVYLENREVVDLLKQHEPNWVGEAKQILREAVASQSGWKLEVESDKIVRFRPAEWEQFSPLQTGTGWSPSESLILFEFILWDNEPHSNPYLQLTLSPGSDEAIRERLFDAVRQHPEVFQPTKSVLVSGYTVLHKQWDYILDDADYGPRWDDGSVRAKMMDWVSTFARDTFPDMYDIIANCLAEYEQEKVRRRPRRARS